MTSDEMMEYFLSQIEEDLQETLPKAEEYGGSDLDIMGEAMWALIGNQFPDATVEEAVCLSLEAAVAFYMLGKVARAFGAYARGIRPKDDTWFDMTVYSLMGRYVREHGEWKIDHAE